ncbi:hypothetical protein PAXRUDRAFT_135286 [Paxillus rubicundulus Ve08.2h10]|uniref:Unplaced genomic scaffold scaffold_92, whole genome shotgun sequence n=1 Tax=Paxillus rubicundulus Ve08.2h10 TaxID=930991 RepID=A0A0D0DUG3_9AGAM|nr:hypothetical protein PAXRUDRAFT_135286 [Paxillus rubicundulus Ve08.2h10]
MVTYALLVQSNIFFLASQLQLEVPLVHHCYCPAILCFQVANGVAQLVPDVICKCHTKAEIEADKECLEEECQKAKQVHQAGLECIATIQDRQSLEEPKWPLPQPITSSSNTSNIQVSSFSIPTVTSKTTTPSALKPPPSHSPTPLSVSAEAKPPVALLDDDDTAEHVAVHSLVELHKSKNIDYGKPPFTQKPTLVPTAVESELVDVAMDVMVELSNSEDDLIIVDDLGFGHCSAPIGTARTQKWTTTLMSDQTRYIISIFDRNYCLYQVTDPDHSSLPSSKHTQTKPVSGCVQDGTSVKSTKKVKYNNSHLPPGAMTDNK